MKKRILILMLLVFSSVLFLSTVNIKEASYEAELEVEEWMTEPFVESMEDPLVLEDWMTKPFKIN